MEDVFDGAIAIDLGTTSSRVGVWKDDRIEIIADEQGNRSTPSYVAFLAEGRLIGNAAKNQAEKNPCNTVFDVKRLIGCRYADPDVQRDMAHWPFGVVEKDGAPLIKVTYLGEEKTFTPQEISSMILSRMKEIAETKLGKVVKKAVITVPAHFNGSQRSATQVAGIIAGLDVLQLINEPTAAAAAYGLDRKSNLEKNVLVFHLGGGTFDVSLLNMKGGVFAVKATAGDPHLGGEDFDSALLEHFKNEFKQKHKLDISQDPRALRRLRDACERAKCTLSSVSQTTVEVDSLFEGVDFSASITRDHFEELNASLFNSTLEPVKRVLEDAKIPREKVDDIVLVGGSTRIPKIQNLVSGYFGGRQLNKLNDPEEAVISGATIQAAILTGHTSETTQDIVLLDVTPLSLGVALVGDIFGIVIPRNTPIPTTKSRVFSTVEDNQTVVLFPVYQGERMVECSKNNHYLGEFLLTGVPPMPRGRPELDTTFDINTSGLLNVTARDRTSGSKASISIANSVGRLSTAEVERMMKDAERFKYVDKELEARQTAKMEAKYDLKSYINQVKGMIVSPGTRMGFSRGAKERVEAELDRALEKLENEDTTTDEFRKLKNNITQALQGATAGI